MKSSVVICAVLTLGWWAPSADAADQSITVGGRPTPAESAAIRHALGADYAEMAPFDVGHADLNGDGKPDLIIRSGNSDYCGSGGCATAALLATARGFEAKQIDLAYSAGNLIVLPTTHRGMHDIRFDGGAHSFTWSGTAYR